MSREKISKYTVLWIIQFALGIGALNSQQNLFNVPSSEITTKKKIFFQQQLNVSDAIQSNTNFCYGLGKNFEIGMNLIGLQTNVHFNEIRVNDSLDGEPIAPLGLLTFQKVLDISSIFKMGIGTQIGTNIISHNSKNRFLANFTYVNSQTNFFDNKLKMNLGLYFSNNAYEGDQSEIGVMGGYEFTLSKKIHLVGDWISGDNHIGVGVIGGMYYVTPSIPLSFGLQIPNDTKKDPYAFVFEFTYVPN